MRKILFLLMLSLSCNVNPYEFAPIFEDGGIEDGGIEDGGIEDGGIEDGGIVDNTSILVTGGGGVLPDGCSVDRYHRFSNFLAAIFDFFKFEISKPELYKDEKRFKLR